MSTTTIASLSSRVHPDVSPRLALQISERRVLLLVVDAVLLLAAGQGALVGWNLLRSGRTLGDMNLMPYESWVFWLTAVWMGLIALLGGYDLRVSARVLTVVRCLAVTAAIYAVGYMALFFLTASRSEAIPLFRPLGGQPYLLRVVPVLFGGIALLLEIGWRSLYALVLTGEYFQQRILVVGAGRAGQTLIQALNARPGSGYRIVGYIDDDPSKLGQVIEKVPVLGNHTEIVGIALQQGVNEIVLSLSSSLQGSAFESILNCFEHGIQITPMPLMYERLTGRVPVEYVGQQWYVSLPLSATPPSLVFRVVQRTMDILVALLGLTLLAVLCPVVALGNALWSPGPLFYRQTRVGKSGKLFRVVKFRTMVPDAEKQCGAVWARKNDPRTTSFGRWLRKSRLDEMPQCWNVLKGEMSLVGPRPERPEFVDDLAAHIPFYRSRHAVRPGITGWAQVWYRYGNSVEDALVKLQYDLFYIKHQSLYLNLLILFKTIGVILRMSGT